MTDDIKAIKDALADVSRDGPHYFDWLGAATPERIARLLDALEQASKDAERYRWLRSQHWSDSTLAVVRNPKDAVKLGHQCPSLDNLDAAIDAAMSDAPGA